mmetsp:Transcript_7446/g.23472  ORF Transcript_7446/g.23472 Transcript_7446/m.23472 type:complete len:220 (-) Transcript_7446:1046-1705(-)
MRCNRQRRDHAPRRATPASQRPEQTGVVRCLHLAAAQRTDRCAPVVDGDQGAIRSHQLCGHKVVHAQPYRWAKGAVATTQRPAHHTHCDGPARGHKPGARGGDRLRFAERQAGPKLQSRLVWGPLCSFHERRPDHEALVAAVSIQKVMASSSDAHAQVVVRGELDSHLHMLCAQRPHHKRWCPPFERVVTRRDEAVLWVEAVEEAGARPIRVGLHVHRL